VDEVDAAAARPAPSNVPTAAPVTQRRATSRRLRAAWLLVLALVVAAIVVPLSLGDGPPSRLALVGDSLMAGAAPDIAADLGLRANQVNASLAVDGAGLLDTDPDWLSRARTLVSEFDPTVVVVEYVGNYGTYGAPLPGVSVYSPAFYRDWARQAQRLEDILTARGATVDWVLGPPIAPRVPNRGLQRLDGIYERLHTPGGGSVPSIDITPAVTGGTDRYQAFLPGPNGQRMQIHLAGGVHFTPYGYSLMARAIADGVG